MYGVSLSMRIEGEHSVEYMPTDSTKKNANSFQTKSVSILFSIVCPKNICSFRRSRFCMDWAGLNFVHAFDWFFSDFFSLFRLGNRKISIIIIICITNQCHRRYHSNENRMWYAVSGFRWVSSSAAGSIGYPAFHFIDRMHFDQPDKRRLATINFEIRFEFQFQL